ncbi:hypothetical protein L1049_001126 [Liquidambar formosana]|uniref:Uncharacterized protein n=1 Tax=Liquidambar formosana TaxID=63359 RepID=A0AAP0R5A6_LIQFO
MEDNPASLLVNSVERCDPIVDEVQIPTKESPLISGAGTGFTSPRTEAGASSESSISASEYTFVEDGLRMVETSNWDKCLSKSKELAPPHQLSADYSHGESFRERNSTTASTSGKEQQSSDPATVNVSGNMGAVSDRDNSMVKGVSQICPEVTHPSSSSLQELGDSRSDGVSIENHVHNSNSGSVSVPVISDSPVSFHSLGDESLQEAIPSGLGFLVSNRERNQGDGNVLHVDVVSISSNILSSSDADISIREARRNSRRLFWDAFSRRSSRRHIDSPTIVFSADDTDDLGSHDRWLLDFSGDFSDDGVGGDYGYLGSRFRSMNERRQQSRSEVVSRTL